MARPTKPKDLKPKTDGEAGPAPMPLPGGGGGAALDIKFIAALAVMAIVSLLGAAGSSYVVAEYVIKPELAKTVKSAPTDEEDSDAHGGGHGSANQIGMNLELDEFTVNLKPDTQLGGTQYLRAKVALSIKVPDAENCYAQHAAAYVIQVGGGKIAGAAAPIDKTLVASGGSSGPTCEDIFKNNMGKFVPTIRDVVNASLMKRTASTLATLEGQESLKDEVKEQLNAIMAPNYEVLRVNFQDFIIQR